MCDSHRSPVCSDTCLFLGKIRDLVQQLLRHHFSSAVGGDLAAAFLESNSSERLESSLVIPLGGMFVNVLFTYVERFLLLSNCLSVLSA